MLISNAILYAREPHGAMPYYANDGVFLPVNIMIVTLSDHDKTSIKSKFCHYPVVLF